MNELNQQEKLVVEAQFANIKNNLVDETNWNDIMSTAPIMMRRQPLKTTPIRIVHELTWLNDQIVSVPNDEGPPSEALQYIRK